jgi:hypothetical protein
VVMMMMMMIPQSAMSCSEIYQANGNDNIKQ